MDAKVLTKALIECGWATQDQAEQLVKEFQDEKPQFDLPSDYWGRCRELAYQTMLWFRNRMKEKDWWKPKHSRK